MTDEKIDIETPPVDDSIETNNAEEKTKNIFQSIYNLIMVIYFMLLLLSSLFPLRLQNFIVGSCIFLILALLWRISLHDRKKVRFIPYFILLLLFCYMRLRCIDYFSSGYIDIISSIIIGVLLFTNNKIARYISALVIVILFPVGLGATFNTLGASCMHCYC